MTRLKLTLTLLVLANASLCLAGPAASFGPEIQVGNARTLPLRLPARGDYKSGKENVPLGGEEARTVTTGEAGASNSGETVAGNSVGEGSGSNEDPWVGNGEEAEVEASEEAEFEAHVEAEAEASAETEVEANVETEVEASVETDDEASVEAKIEASGDKLDLYKLQSSNTSSSDSIEAEERVENTELESETEEISSETSDSSSNESQEDVERQNDAATKLEGVTADESIETLESEEEIDGSLNADPHKEELVVKVDVPNPKSPFLIQRKHALDAGREGSGEDVSGSFIRGISGAVKEEALVEAGVEEIAEASEAVGAAMGRIAEQEQPERSQSGSGVVVVTLFVAALLVCVALFGVYYTKMSTPNLIALEGDDVTLYDRGPQYQAWGRLPGYSLD